MDYLQRVGATQIRHLFRSDAQRVARALRDHTLGRARLTAGSARGIRYVSVQVADEDPVVIREDDWKRIVPFIRYGSEALATVATSPVSATPPDQILSPQPNHTIAPPPQNPGPGLTSFLAGISYDEYQKIIALLPLARPYGNGVYEWLVAVLEELFPTDYPTST